MSKTCPFCLESNLPDNAIKCRACGSWLDEGPELDPREARRRDAREELRADLKDHRSLIESMLKRVQVVGGMIIVAAFGASLFFGYATDKSITETSARVSKDAKVKIDAAASDITNAAMDEIRRGIKDKLASADTRKVIDETLNKAVSNGVQHEIATRIVPVTDEAVKQVNEAVQQVSSAREQIELAKVRLLAFEKQVGDLEKQSARESDRLERIQASFKGAQTLTVESSTLKLPVDLIQMEEKGGIGQLRDMLERGVDALGYRLGSYYYAPMVWRYFDSLKSLKQFRYVLILSANGGELVGVLDAATLTSALDPDNTAELRESLGDDLGYLPNDDQVTRWGHFVEWLTEQKLDRIHSLPSFRQAGTAVHLDANSLEVLNIMEELGVDLLPVTDANSNIVGIIDRPRLTARVLLEIANPR